MKKKVAFNSQYMLKKFILSLTRHLEILISDYQKGHKYLLVCLIQINYFQ